MSWWDADDDEDEFDEFDESDVRVRPNRRGSRPRTKMRPDHADAVQGTVLGVRVDLGDACRARRRVHPDRPGGAR